MKTMDIVKKRIIITMISIVLLVITLFGITYAFFVSSVVGNNEEQVSVSAGKLAIDYADGNGIITAKKIIPGTKIAQKTFTVKNSGRNLVESYEVIVENVINELVNFDDLTYTLTCKSYKTSDYEKDKDKATETGTCLGNEGIFPKHDNYLTRNQIDVGMTHSYILTLTFHETNEDQSIDMNKKIEAKVNILDDELNYKNVLVYGNSIQDGIPTPTSPVEIKSVGDKITNMIDYKSLLNANVPYTKDYYGITGVYDNEGTLTLSGTSNCTHDAVDFMLFDSKNMEPGTYTISGVPYDSENGSYRLFGHYFENGAHIAKYINNSTTQEGPLTFTIEENQGISFSVRISRKFVDIKKLKVKPILQKGTETFEPVGYYRVPIDISGKNLINLNNSSLNQTGSIIEKTGIGYKLTSENKNGGYANYFWIANVLENVEGKTLTISANVNMSDEKMSPIMRLGYWDSSMVFRSFKLITINNNGSNSMTVTIPAEMPSDIKAEYGICLFFNINVNATIETPILEVSNIQIEEGTTATSFEPYIEPQTYNIILDEPLRKVGDCDTCADYIDLYNGKVYRYIKKHEFTGKETWQRYDTTVNAGNNFTLDITDAKYDNNQYILSNEYIGAKSGSGTSYGNGNIWLQSTSTYPRLYLFDTNYTKDTLKTHLQEKYQNGNPLYVVYPLNERKVEPIDINIPKIDKNSIITVGTEIEPSKIETEY